MDFDFAKNDNFNCFFVDYSFSDDLIELYNWRNVCHFGLFNELKMSFGSCYIDLRIDKCYVIAQWGAYVLDIKEYKKFLKIYYKKEKKFIGIKMVFENFKFILNGTYFNLTKVCFSDSYINVFIWDKTNRYFLFKILMDYNYAISVSIRYCIIADKVFIRIGRNCYVLDVKEYKKFLKLCFVKEDIINWKEDGFYDYKN